MLSESHNFIFVHGRKAGGKSLREALRPLLSDEHYLNFGVFSDSTAGIGRSGVWSREAHGKYRIFTNVRNPWDRAVSNYRYFGLGARLFGKPVGFAEFLERLPTADENIDAWIHTTANYASTITDEQGCICDAIIRFENLENDFLDVIHSFDLPVSTALDHIGAGNKRMPHRSAIVRHLTGRPGLRGAFKALVATGDYKDYYTSYTRTLVSKRFEQDIDTFRYVY